MAHHDELHHETHAPAGLGTLVTTIHHRRGYVRLGSVDWQPLIQGAKRQRPSPVVARTRLPHPWPESFARPRLIKCSDGGLYVVKGMNKAGRSLVAEHVVSRLGRLIGAPVVDVVVVDLPKTLVDEDGELRHFPPGLSHGCRYVTNCTNKEWIRTDELRHHRAAFASLAILYGWTIADDYQVIYSKVPPPAVYSVDHGHFFAPETDSGAGTWTQQTLAEASAAIPDARIVEDCALTRTELSTAAERLRTVTTECIAEVVAGPPDEWLRSIDDRVALAEFLAARRDTMAGALTGAD